jgi:hypothetical protein
VATFYVKIRQEEARIASSKKPPSTMVESDIGGLIKNAEMAHLEINGTTLKKGIKNDKTWIRIDKEYEKHK